MFKMWLLHTGGYSLCGLLLELRVLFALSLEEGLFLLLKINGLQLLQLRHRHLALYFYFFLWLLYWVYCFALALLLLWALHRVLFLCLYSEWRQTVNVNICTITVRATIFAFLFNILLFLCCLDRQRPNYVLFRRSEDARIINLAHSAFCKI